MKTTLTATLSHALLGSEIMQHIYVSQEGKTVLLALKMFTVLSMRLIDPKTHSHKVISSEEERILQ